MLSKNINKQSKNTIVKKNLLFCYKIKYCLGSLETQMKIIRGLMHLSINR